MKIFISCLGLFMALALWLCVPKTSLAFNLFCTTDSSGNCISGPCKDNPQAPTCQQAKDQGGPTTNRVTGTGNIINVAASILAIVTGVAAIIIIIIGGFTLVTSGGSTEAVASARRRIVYALVGLVIIALAWTITRFITDRLVQ